MRGGGHRPLRGNYFYERLRKLKQELKQLIIVIKQLIKNERNLKAGFVVKGFLGRFSG